MSTRLDLDGDELIDLAVGAHGSAVLLRWGGKFWKHVGYSLFRLNTKSRFAFPPQLSKHSPDQRESLLPAAFHQCDTEDLPERRQRISLSECDSLLYHGLPLPRTTRHQLWYDRFADFVYGRLEREASNAHRLSRPPASSSDLWVSATLDDRKLSARALFDDSSHRQTQLSARVHTGQTVCYRLPFHVYVSLAGN